MLKFLFLTALPDDIKNPDNFLPADIGGAFRERMTVVVTTDKNSNMATGMRINLRLSAITEVFFKKTPSFIEIYIDLSWILCNNILILNKRNNRRAV